MAGRARKTHRLVRVQGQMKRIEEWRLAELEHRLSEGEAAERELIAALNADHVLYGLFIDAMARRLQSLGEEAGRLRGLKAAQVQRLLVCAGRLKNAERLAAAADDVAGREEARKDLLDLVEVFVAHGTQASRKASAS